MITDGIGPFSVKVPIEINSLNYCSNNELFYKLYLLRFQEGDQIKENGKLIKVDKQYREEQYEQLQDFLDENGKNRSKEIQKILLATQKKCSNAIQK